MLASYDRVRINCLRGFLPLIATNCQITALEIQCRAVRFVCT